MYKYNPIMEQLVSDHAELNLLKRKLFIYVTIIMFRQINVKEGLIKKFK